MAEDGLLPSIFAHVTPKGNLFWGTLLGGVMAVIIAGWVPFSYITDLISAGCLLSFQLTNTACVFVHADPTMAVEITTSAYDEVVTALEAEEGSVADLTLGTLTRAAAQNPGSGVFDRPAAGRRFVGGSGRGGGRGWYGAAESSEDASIGEGAASGSEAEAAAAVGVHSRRASSARSREASDADDEGGASDDEGYAPSRRLEAEVLTIHVPTRGAWASATVRTLAVCFHAFAFAAALLSKPLLSRSVTLETRDDAERALHHTLVALTLATTLLAVACASLVCGFAWGWEALGNGGGGCGFWTDLPVAAVEAVKDCARSFAQCGGCCAACCCTSAAAAEAAAAAASARGATRPSSLSAALMAEANEGRTAVDAANAASGAAADVVPIAGGDAPRFITPGGPLLPLIGSGFNWFLLAQLRWASMGLLVAYVAIAVLTYFVFGCVGAGAGACAGGALIRVRSDSPPPTHTLEAHTVTPYFAQRRAAPPRRRYWSAVSRKTPPMGAVRSSFLLLSCYYSSFLLFAHYSALIYSFACVGPSRASAVQRAQGLGLDAPRAPALLAPLLRYGSLGRTRRCVRPWRQRARMRRARRLSARARGVSAHSLTPSLSLPLPLSQRTGLRSRRQPSVPSAAAATAPIARRRCGRRRPQRARSRSRCRHSARTTLRRVGRATLSRRSAL
jgi:hypothetical protein